MTKIFEPLPSGTERIVNTVLAGFAVGMLFQKYVKPLVAFPLALVTVIAFQFLLKLVVSLFVSKPAA